MAELPRVDFARLAPGRVCGIDPSADVIAAARRDHPGVEFATGDVYDMAIDGASWDVVHAHQLLQHVPDPVTALGWPHAEPASRGSVPAACTT